MADLPSWIGHGVKCVCIKDTSWECADLNIITLPPEYTPQFMQEYTIEGWEATSAPYDTWMLVLKEFGGRFAYDVKAFAPLVEVPYEARTSEYA